MKRAKAKVSYAPCAWCKEWTKQIVMFTCLDTGNTSVESQWLEGLETHERESTKVCSHGICPGCLTEQYRMLNDFAKVGEGKSNGNA